MKAFEYATALSTDSARELVADHGAYLAGGNDLLGLLKDYLVPGPDILVNIKSLPGLNQIERGDKIWTIGALVTVAEIEHDAEIAKVFPGLHDAAAEIASPQIRNVATVGGNLAQHSRCWYFRQRDIVCLKKGGDLCYARERRQPLPQPVHRQRLHQPGRVQPGHDVRRARRHRHRAARRQGNAHEHGRALPEGVGRNRPRTIRSIPAT